MSCPFKHLWPGGAPNPHAAAPSNAPDPTSPPITEAPHAPVTNPTPPAASPAVCPLGFGSSQVPSHPAPDPGSSGPATCPLGFGVASKGPPLTPLHCLVCKSLLYGAVTAACGHSYCGGCAGKLRDCPKCGADVAGLEPNPDLQAAVDKVIEAHTSGTVLHPPSSTGESANSATSTSTSTPDAFLLDLSVKALTGGNPESAAHRLALCKSVLQTELASASGVRESGDEDATKGFKRGVKSRLGAVCGLSGDAARALGDSQAALTSYQESAEHLRSLADTDAEAAHALSVSLNKAGEVCHVAGDLPRAIDYYKQALDVRKSRLHALKTNATADQLTASLNLHTAETAPQQQFSQAYCAAALDVATSSIKVGDAMVGAADLAGTVSPQQYLDEAGRVLGEVAGRMAGQSAGLQRKFTQLMAYFDAGME